MTSPPFGRQQLRIMLVLWDKGQATAREVMEVLNRVEPVTESTVRTILRRLEKKGAITHDVDGRTFIFRPLKDEENVRGNATREMLGRLFDGSSGELVSYLLEHEHFTPEERDAIGAFLEEMVSGFEKKPRAHSKEERARRPFAIDGDLFNTQLIARHDQNASILPTSLTYPGLTDIQ